MAGDAEVSTIFCCRFEQGFHGSALGEDLVDVGHGADIVQLPEVDVVGLEQLQRLFDHRHGAVARAFLGFGREERFVAAALITLPTYCSLQRSGPP